MIRSMTGYGRYQDTVDGMDITVEIKAVNHRYYEYSSRLPRAYGFLDDKLKAYLQGSISRGKVDVYVFIDTADAPGSRVTVNHSLVQGYLKALGEIAETYGLRNDVSVMSLARYPDLLTVHREAEDEEAVWAAVRTVADVALNRFLQMREKEGEKLQEDILSRAAAILEAVGQVEERSPQTVREHMDKVQTRMRELLGTATVDEQRLLTEAALFADKIAVVQEINREANTIGSKAQDVQLARVVVDIKAEIEKIREQIQNIE